MKPIVYEGVTFVTEACVSMGKAKFVSFHAPLLWQDIDEAERKKMLAEAWSLMAQEKKAKK